jgi:hypothetical protein
MLLPFPIFSELVVLLNNLLVTTAYAERAFLLSSAFV